jgi:D-lactate dehydrogenase
MRIAFFDMAHWDDDRLKNFFPDDTATFYDYSIHEENTESIRDVEVIVTFISSHINRTTLEAFPNLKLVCTMSTSTDHIDIQACNEHDVTVCNVPYQGENAVAEHTFALMLGCARKLVESVLRTREDNFSPKGLEGFDLAGKTLGVIGTGHIGMHVVKIAKGFSMDVLAHDVVEHDDVAKEYQFKYTDLDTLLRTSDIITLHIPYSEETHYFIGEEEFAKMKDDAILIHTVKGPVVDTRALVNALEDDRLFGAGLDYIEDEEQMGRRAATSEQRETFELNEELLRMKNVLITPHGGMNTQEALRNVELATVRNIEAFIEGEPTNVITR